MIRVDPRADSDLVGRCFLYGERLIVGDPSMRPGPPARAFGLTITQEDKAWQVSNKQGSHTFFPDPVLRLASLMMVRDAVLAGGGAAMLPLSLVARGWKRVVWRIGVPSKARPPQSGSCIPPEEVRVVDRERELECRGPDTLEVELPFLDCVREIMHLRIGRFLVEIFEQNERVLLLGVVDKPL